MKKILHLVVATIVLLFQGAFISPALWNQGSSSAFDFNIFLWVVILLWWGYTIADIYDSVNVKLKKSREG